MTRRRRTIVRTFAILAALALWFVVSVPWGMPITQLAVFVAPGALLGLGASWTAYAGDRTRWTWYVARRHAAVGAMFLPPILAFLVALDGNTRPPRLLAGFVRAAWLALLVGAAFAVADAMFPIRSKRRREKMRRELQQSLSEPAPAELP